MKLLGESAVTSLVRVLFLLCCVDAVTARRRVDQNEKWVRKALQKRQQLQASKRQTNDPSANCAAKAAAPLKAAKSNVWLPLSDVEVADVVKWLFAQKDLNLTTSAKAGEWDNTIYNVELMLPNKTDALAYIDGNARPPTRYAHVTLAHSATVDPYYQEMLVGPFPIDNATTTWTPLAYPYTRKSGGRIRNLEADDSKTIYTAWLYKVADSIRDITLDLWNATAGPAATDTLDIWGIDPFWQDDGITRWDTFWRFRTDIWDDETLLPLGLFFKSNVTGRDPSKWKLQGWLYNDIFYETTADFRKAYFTPGFEKLPPNDEGQWSHSNKPTGFNLPFDTNYPPTQVAPAGARYFVNPAQKFVKWMDFEFYITFTHNTGVKLFDIRYKGKRIIYELGLQEAMAHYAGNDPVQSGTTYLDSYYGFGKYSFAPVKGYDCPTHATYLNTSFYAHEILHTHIGGICLFEMDAGYPIQRHTTSHYVAVTKNIIFTVRNVCTVGNYDYMFSYEFYMDGSIHIEVRASGYIQSAYWAHNGDYGYHIHDALSGSMHDHVLNYKIDFDIHGTSNTMQITENVPVSETYKWSNGQARNTMKIKRSTVESEDQAKLDWGHNGVKQYKIVNTDMLNKYGEAPGYRILPSSGTIHSTITNSSNIVNAAKWSEHDIFVTRQHDTEPRSAYPFNTQDVADPMINFYDFFNGESLMQEDLVVWVNLGMHHIPHTGDLPNTVLSTAHSGLQIMPLNYLYSDPSRETNNMIQINYHNGKVFNINEFGSKAERCELNFTAQAANYEEYKGDLCIYEYPFQPNDPFWATHFYI